MKRNCSIFLAVCMLLSILPVQAFASNSAPTEVYCSDGIYIYSYETDDCTIYLQNMDDCSVQATLLYDNSETRILDLNLSAVLPNPDFSLDFTWLQIAQTVMQEMDKARPIGEYVCEAELRSPELQPFSVDATGGEDILRQIRAIHGREYTDRLKYSKNDAYQSKVYEDLEYLIKLADIYEVQEKLSVASFVSGVLGFLPGSILYKATMAIISGLAGGTSLLIDTSVTIYTATALFTQYGYCMGEPWVDYGSDYSYNAYGITDEYGVLNGSYELCTEPHYQATVLYFGNYERIIEEAIKMYQYWG